MFQNFRNRFWQNGHAYCTHANGLMDMTTVICQRRLYETEQSRSLQVIRQTATSPADKIHYDHSPQRLLPISVEDKTTPRTRRI